MGEIHQSKADDIAIHTNGETRLVVRKVNVYSLRHFEFDGLLGEHQIEISIMWLAISSLSYETSRDRNKGSLALFSTKCNHLVELVEVLQVVGVAKKSMWKNKLYARTYEITFKG